MTSVQIQYDRGAFVGVCPYVCMCHQAENVCRRPCVPCYPAGRCQQMIRHLPTGNKTNPTASLNTIIMQDVRKFVDKTHASLLHLEKISMHRACSSGDPLRFRKSSLDRNVKDTVPRSTKGSSDSETFFNAASASLETFSTTFFQVRKVVSLGGRAPICKQTV